MDAPAIIVHSLDHTRAALAAARRAGRPVTLVSAPGAALYAGAGFWKAMIEQGRTEFPEADCRAILDCGDDAGVALGALREGIAAIAFHGPPRVHVKIVDIAKKLGAAVLRDAAAGAPALDLLDFPDPLGACLDWLEDPDRGGKSP